jgi:hypothetical protein
MGTQCFLWGRNLICKYYLGRRTQITENVLPFSIPPRAYSCNLLQVKLTYYKYQFESQRRVNSLKHTHTHTHHTHTHTTHTHTHTHTHTRPLASAIRSTSHERMHPIRIYKSYLYGYCYCVVSARHSTSRLAASHSFPLKAKGLHCKGDHSPKLTYRRGLYDSEGHLQA